MSSWYDVTSHYDSIQLHNVLTLCPLGKKNHLAVLTRGLAPSSFESYRMARKWHKGFTKDFKNKEDGFYLVRRVLSCKLTPRNAIGISDGHSYCIVEIQY